jgi:hypothetical protein
MSIDSLARGAIGPQPSGPKRQRRTAAGGFFVPRGMPPLGGRGKKPTKPLRKAIEAHPPHGP